MHKTRKDPDLIYSLWRTNIAVDEISLIFLEMRNFQMILKEKIAVYEAGVDLRIELPRNLLNIFSRLRQRLPYRK